MPKRVFCVDWCRSKYDISQNLLCAVCCVPCFRSQQEELYKNKMWFAVLICADDHESRTRTKCDLPAHCLALSDRWARWARWTNQGKTSLGQNENLSNNFFKVKRRIIGWRQELCGSRMGWNGRGASSLKTRSHRMVVAFLVGERIREGKILFVVAADSLPGKVLCRGHYFQLSTKSFWSQAWSSWDEISQWLLSTLKCSSENLNQSTNLHQHDTNQLSKKIIL